MRLTLPRLGWQNRHKMYRFFWQRERRARIKDTGDLQFCLENGIAVTDAKNHLQVFDIENQEQPKPPIIIRESRERVKYREVQKHFFFNINNCLIAEVPQARILTNSVIFHHLPKELQDASETDLSTEEYEDSLSALKEAHLLDSYQHRLKDVRYIADKERFPTPPYGIPIQRRCELLIQNYLTLVERQLPFQSLRNSFIIKDTSCQATVDHRENKLTQNYDAAYLILRKSALPPILNEDEVALLNNAELPDIFPQSPYIMYFDKDTSTLPTDHFCTNTRRLRPHTIYLVNNNPKPHLDKPDIFTYKSLMSAFTFATAYAKQIHGLDFSQDLSSPITLQLVHVAQFYSQVCVFQLNTLDLTGPRRNAFWYQPAVRHYESCDFHAASPCVEDFNPYLYKLMKALHSVGL